MGRFLSSMGGLCGNKSITMLKLSLKEKDALCSKIETMSKEKSCNAQGGEIATEMKGHDGDNCATSGNIRTRIEIARKYEVLEDFKLKLSQLSVVCSGKNEEG
ncbi:Uncharacterized protein TCM_044522 [Theobroma cacao]|uniref:Uncharacterized protein n=1 Tax=Theobroma cacao TaxID=3641 RepID=A0A061FQ30_THECC|nr:Uncharacterized protein TCM_044522 [Theobroma cacao]